MDTALDLRRIAKEMGGAQETNDDLKRFSDDARWFHSMHSTLIDKHPDLWIAVYEREVEATGSTLEELLDAIHQQGIPRGRAVIGFMDTDPKTFIL